MNPSILISSDNCKFSRFWVVPAFLPKQTAGKDFVYLPPSFEKTKAGKDKTKSSLARQQLRTFVPKYIHNIVQRSILKLPLFSCWLFFYLLWSPKCPYICPESNSFKMHSIVVRTNIPLFNVMWRMIPYLSFPQWLFAMCFICPLSYGLGTFLVLFSTPPLSSHAYMTCYKCFKNYMRISLIITF